MTNQCIYCDRDISHTHSINDECKECRQKCHHDEDTKCVRCVETFTSQCAKCGQRLEPEDAKPLSERSFFFSEIQDWALSFNDVWDWKCLHCDQRHVELGTEIRGTYLLPVDENGDKEELEEVKSDERIMEMH
jgi:hypothetical protein